MPCGQPLRYTERMNALTFASAYSQLRPTQKLYVDAYVADVEREAERRNERISNALHRVIPPEVVAASGGMLDISVVRIAIAERINDLAVASEITVSRWIKEVASIAFSSVENYQQVDEFGQATIDLTRATPEALAAVKSVETEEAGSPFERARKRKTKLILHDKMAALKMLGDYMGVMQPDNPHFRASQQRPASEPVALPPGATVADASDLYARTLDGN